VGKVTHKEDMIIELGNIHVKRKLLIETCILLVNKNGTMWIGILLGVCS
jgi:hypothetical protein